MGRSTEKKKKRTSQALSVAYVAESSWSVAFGSWLQLKHESMDFPFLHVLSDVLHVKHLAPPLAVPVAWLCDNG